ncbi:MAG: ATPase, partial [Prevotella salivae]|nr:ATPase [Segatella salivae]
AAIERSLSDSLFISEDDRREIKHYLTDFYKEIAFTRQDLAKIEG